MIAGSLGGLPVDTPNSGEDTKSHGGLSRSCNRDVRLCAYYKLRHTVRTNRYWLLAVSHVPLLEVVLRSDHRALEVLTEHGGVGIRSHAHHTKSANCAALRVKPAHHKLVPP